MLGRSFHVSLSLWLKSNSLQQLRTCTIELGTTQNALIKQPHAQDTG